ncbi:hypothetical protein [Streptomyces sp. NPDC015131]|uniref:hypothetical protein n=1 Tax=Streptomyces sp. NPDC015131 TaxID=3364941 RepID=UPI0037006FFA
MATTDDYGQGVSIAALTDAPNAETLARNIANAVVERSNMRFASASARNAALASPVEGMEAWLQDSNTKTIYDGTAWNVQSKLLLDWTAFASIGSFAAGVTAGTPAPRLRKISEFGTEVWEIEGRLNLTSLPAATTTTVFTFGASYRPANTRGFMTYNSSHHGTRITIPATGVMTVSVPTEAGSAVSSVWLDGIRITNPAA